MKKIFIPLFSLITTGAVAQTKVVTQAIVTTKTTIVSSEEDNAPQQTVSDNGGEMRVMRFGGDGETKSVTTLKGDMVKTFTESEMGRTTILRDNKNKKTTTLMEMMGRKFGFYATDEEQAQMSKEMDSLMQARRQGNDGPSMGNNTPSTYEVVNVDGTKKIAGVECKKALIVRTRGNGKKDTSFVWYNPEIKLQGVNSTGGGGGGMMMNFSRNAGNGGLDKLDGFPMQYEMQMGPTRKMTVEVTKLVTDKEIADKEFDIPKDYDVKPAKEMQGPGGGRGGFQIRVGG